MQKTQALSFPPRLGALTLAYRVVLAPLTRMRVAHLRNVPHALNVEYHRQRVSQGGLIVSECISTSPMRHSITVFGPAGFHLSWRKELGQYSRFFDAGVIGAILKIACGFAAANIHKRGLTSPYSVGLVAPAVGGILIAR